MHTEDELLPLSALSQLVYCERRAALIFYERLWEDNVCTAEGANLHERVHMPTSISRPGIRIAHELQLHSLRLGIWGKADVVEFHALEGDRISHPSGIPLPGIAGQYQPYPIEYKRGKLRQEEAYRVQLCAQALCLEEMLKVPIPSGSIFFGKTKRRLEVIFSKELKTRTEQASIRLHDLMRKGNTPKARYSKKCDFCSLAAVCLPKSLSSPKITEAYLKQAFDAEEG